MEKRGSQPQGQQIPPSNLLLKRDLIFCSLVTKGRFPRVAMETRLPYWLGKTFLAGADNTLEGPEL